MILENRSTDLTKLYKAADYLGRSLRENLDILFVDSANNKVTFLSEQGNVIACDYAPRGGSVDLSNFNIKSSEEYLDEIPINEAVEGEITGFVGSLHKDDYITAETCFSNVIDLFEQRNSLSTTKVKLEEALGNFSDSVKVLETAEWNKLLEVKPMLVNFIKENRAAVEGTPDVVNALKLSAAISTTFDVPRQTCKTLQESKKYSVDFNEKDKSLYEVICQQELVRRELLEAKKEFSNAWMGNEEVQKLASCIYSKDKVVKEAIVEAIEKVPYFALAPKKDIKSIFESVYDINSSNIINKQDVKEFVSKVFEWKKPAKEYMISMLNEKYGINVQNLKFIPTFGNLAKTQSALFEVLSLVVEKKGLLKDVLMDFSKSLKTKGGVEILEVNDFIKGTFAEALPEMLTENSLVLNYLDVPRLQADLEGLRSVMGLMGGMGPGMEEGMGEEMPEEGMEEMPEEGMEEEMPEEMPEEGMGEEMPEEGMEEEGMEEEGMEEEMPEEGMGEEIPEEGMEEEMPEEGMGEEEEIDPSMGSEGNGDAVGDDSDGALPPEGGEENLGDLIGSLEDILRDLRPKGQYGM